LKDMLPEGNTLPNRNYEAKKILCPMGMEYKKIHACPNDCILYRKDFELLKSCPRCGLSHYKLKQKDDDSIDEMEKHGPPMNVMWYLPIIPRMKRSFTKTAFVNVIYLFTNAVITKIAFVNLKLLNPHPSFRIIYKCGYLK